MWTCVYYKVWNIQPNYIYLSVFIDKEPQKETEIMQLFIIYVLVICIYLKYHIAIMLCDETFYNCNNVHIMLI